MNVLSLLLGIEISDLWELVLGFIRGVVELLRRSRRLRYRRAGLTLPADQRVLGIDPEAERQALHLQADLGKRRLVDMATKARASR